MAQAHPSTDLRLQQFHFLLRKNVSNFSAWVLLHNTAEDVPAEAFSACLGTAIASGIATPASIAQEAGVNRDDVLDWLDRTDAPSPRVRFEVITWLKELSKPMH
ncbi:MAG TPA: hypothetical protein VGB97_00390 [Candidatus Paceibacterota bacterium]|jgi:hypothetical protein